MTQLQAPENRDLDLQNAKLAYTIINRLLEHNETLSDLLALMAQTMDDEVQKALTNTPPWQKYLESRRELDTTKKQIEKFADELKRLAENQDENLSE